jgi:ElaB/YqjD/DUF883 family membrane-anchored ribosome-binding protein
MAERDHLSGSAAAPAPTEANGERSADDIRQDIAARRDSISETVEHLSDRFQRTLDWRTYVTDYPLAALGVAVGAGFLLAGLFKRRSTPSHRIYDAVAEVVEDVTDRFRHQLDGVGINKSSGLSRTVKAAATGALTKAATDYLRNRLAERGVMRPNLDDYTAVVNASAEQRHYTEYAARH